MAGLREEGGVGGLVRKLLGERSAVRPRRSTEATSWLEDREAVKGEFLAGRGLRAEWKCL